MFQYENKTTSSSKFLINKWHCVKDELVAITDTEMFHFHYNTDCKILRNKSKRYLVCCKSSQLYIGKDKTFSESELKSLSHTKRV